MTVKIPRANGESNDVDVIHVAHVQQNGLPTIQRVCELKVKLEAQILSARAVGAIAPDALDFLSMVNEWLMIHTDRRYFDAFNSVTQVKAREETTT